MFYTIYKTTNLLNGKFYIGKHQTKNLDDGYRGSGKLLGRALKKYGAENFTTDILHVFQTEHEMNLAERILVVSDPEVSYNLCPGGHGGFGYINKQGLNLDLNNSLPKEKMQIARSLGGKKASKHPNLIASRVTFKKGNVIWVGRKHSEETKEKMRRSHNPKSHPRGPRGPYKKKLKLEIDV